MSELSKQEEALACMEKLSDATCDLYFAKKYLCEALRLFGNGTDGFNLYPDEAKWKRNVLELLGDN